MNQTRRTVGLMSWTRTDAISTEPRAIAACHLAASAFASETGEDADADPTRVRLSAARVDELPRYRLRQAWD